VLPWVTPDKFGHVLPYSWYSTDEISNNSRSLNDNLFLFTRHLRQYSSNIFRPYLLMIAFLYPYTLIPYSNITKESKLRIANPTNYIACSRRLISITYLPPNHFHDRIVAEHYCRRPCLQARLALDVALMSQSRSTPACSPNV